MSLGKGYRIRGNVREINAEEASEEGGRAAAEIGMKVKLHFGSSSSNSSETRQEAVHWKQEELKCMRAATGGRQRRKKSIEVCTRIVS